MSNYVKTTNFASKDALTTGDPLKLIKGTELNTEYDAIATSSATKTNKKVPATTNNLAGLDASGDLVDSLVESDGAGGLTADITGDVIGALTGNADTATTAAACSGNSATVTTNANLTGDVTSVGNATTLSTATVGSKTAALSIAAIGSYIFALQSTGTKAANSTISGASLTYCGDDGSGTGSPGSGTWRCMGYSLSGRGTLWKRIS